MHLADHIRPLLRDHDCVIIPDFGGLVADVTPARAQPGRQALNPPAKLVAFNQALTRNDGLLVDALSQQLGVTLAQARESLRQSVEKLQTELDATNRTELPGIGIFRRAAGRGLAFEYTGTDNLLTSAFGLPVLAARPVRAQEVRPQPVHPMLRTTLARSRWVKWLPASGVALVVGLLLLANYQVALQADYLPKQWRMSTAVWAPKSIDVAPAVTEPQQATLGQPDFNKDLPVEPTEAAVSESVASDSALAAHETEWPTDEDKNATVPTVAPSTALVPAAANRTKSSARVPAARFSVPAKPVSVTSSATIKLRTGRYYVIAGAYSTLAHAEQGRKVLARNGRPARIILPHPGSRLFRLTAADFPDLVSAQREARRLRVTTRSDYNTLKF